MTTYPAVLFNDDGQFGIMFPDLGGCIATGHSIDDAIHSAQEALMLYLDDLYERGITPPPPSDKKSVSLPPSFGRDSYSVIMITAGLNYHATLPPHW